MDDSPETSLIHVGNNHWMTEAEARAKGLRPIPPAAPRAPIRPYQPSGRDYLFEAAVLAVIIVLGVIFTRGLHTVMWGY